MGPRHPHAQLRGVERSPHLARPREPARRDPVQPVIEPVAAQRGVEQHALAERLALDNRGGPGGGAPARRRVGVAVGGIGGPRPLGAQRTGGHEREAARQLRPLELECQVLPAETVVGVVATESQLGAGVAKARPLPREPGAHARTRHGARPRPRDLDLAQRAREFQT